MTACAMTVGMVPMALALERGSQMQAPLGRAVIGGLVMSTFATLLVRPVDLRGRDRQEGGPLAVDLPGRPRQLRTTTRSVFAETDGDVRQDDDRRRTDRHAEGDDRRTAATSRPARAPSSPGDP